MGNKFRAPQKRGSDCNVMDLIYSVDSMEGLEFSQGNTSQSRILRQPEIITRMISGVFLPGVPSLRKSVAIHYAKLKPKRYVLFLRSTGSNSCDQVSWGTLIQKNEDILFQCLQSNCFKVEENC